MFNEKYQPKTFTDLVFQSDISRKRLEKYATGENTGNLLLYGPYGSSKTTAARIVANQSAKLDGALFEMDVEVLNCADFDSKSVSLLERGWQGSGQNFSYAVLDEFDLVSKRDQAKVRALIDRYEDRNGLILTTNHLELIDGAIQSRCEVIDMPAPMPFKLLPRCKSILTQEGVTLDDSDILAAIKYEKGDMRQVLRQLERIISKSRQKDAA